MKTTKPSLDLTPNPNRSNIILTSTLIVLCLILGILGWNWNRLEQVRIADERMRTCWSLFGKKGSDPRPDVAEFCAFYVSEIYIKNKE